MPEHRRQFSPQFKAEAVQMVIETGKPITQVARDLGIHDGTLGNWVNAWRREHPELYQPCLAVTGESASPWRSPVQSPPGRQDWRMGPLACRSGRPQRPPQRSEIGADRGAVRC
jgi:hypothetical protein